MENTTSELGYAWYTLQTQPNYESKVIEQIETRIKNQGLTEIGEIFAPEKLIVDFVNGVKKERKKRLYSNYIFINMNYNEDIHHKLKGLRGVVGFVGNRAKPTKVPDSDINKMKEQISDDTPKYKVEFDLESTVKIENSGTGFDGFEGIVKHVDYEKGKAKIELHIFGRPTLMDMSLSALIAMKNA